MAEVYPNNYVDGIVRERDALVAELASMTLRYEIRKDESEAVIAELADSRREIDRWIDQCNVGTTRISALEADVADVAKINVDLMKRNRGLVRAVHMASERTDDTALANELRFILRGLAAETLIELTAIERKSEPEHQAQMKWARDVVSSVVIPPACDCNPMPFPNTHHHDCPVVTPAETACEVPANAWLCKCGLVVKKRYACLGCFATEDMTYDVKGEQG